jgi:hypothetical protein
MPKLVRKLNDIKLVNAGIYLFKKEMAGCFGKGGNSILAVMFSRIGLKRGKGLYAYRTSICKGRRIAGKI